MLRLLLTSLLFLINIQFLHAQGSGTSTDSTKKSKGKFWKFLGKAITIAGNSYSSSNNNSAASSSNSYYNQNLPQIQGQPNSVNNTQIQAQPNTINNTQIQRQPNVINNTQIQGQPNSVNNTQIQAQPNTINNTQIQRQPNVINNTQIQQQPNSINNTIIQSQPNTINNTQTQQQPNSVNNTLIQAQPNIINTTQIQAQPISKAVMPVIISPGSDLKELDYVQPIIHNPPLNLNPDYKFYKLPPVNEQKYYTQEDLDKFFKKLGEPIEAYKLLSDAKTLVEVWVQPFEVVATGVVVDFLVEQAVQKIVFKYLVPMVSHMNDRFIYTIDNLYKF